MATQPIDYAALAKQYGATSSTPPPAQKLDYEAIAKQYGSTGYTPPAQLETDTAQSGPMDALGGYAKQGWQAAKDTVSGIASGAAKSADRTVRLFSGLGGNPMAAAKEMFSPDPTLEPKNAAEKVGGGLEQAAEMTATGGPLKEGAEMVAARAPGVLAKILSPAARVGAEALNTGANAAAHGEPVGPAAVVGGAGGAVNEALPWLAPAIKKAAAGQYDRALSASTRPMKVLAKKIEPEMISRGIHGDLDSIGDQAAQQAAAVRPDLNAAYSALPWQKTQGSGWQVLQDLQGLKEKYMVAGKVANPQAVNAINGVQDVVQQYGTDISPDNLRKLKGIFDDPVAAKSGYAGADLTTQYAVKAQKAAADSIRNIVHSASPDISALDKEINFWLNVKKVTGATSTRRVGQEGGLLRTLAPLGMSGASAIGLTLASQGTHASLEAATATFLATHAAMAMRTPGWRTASAVIKDRFADALAAGDVGKVVSLSARFGVGVQGQTQKSAQSGQTSQP